MAANIAVAGQDTDGSTATPAGNFNVAVNLNYELNIPAVLYFRVGSLGSTVDEVEFDLTNTYSLGANTPYTGTPDLPGSGTPIAATTNASLFVEVRSNAGDVELSATVSNPAGLANGLGQFINFSEIDTVSDNAGLPAPELTNAGATPVSVTANLFAGLVTVQTGNWTYSFANTAGVAAGEYTGTVTYTASIP